MNFDDLQTVGEIGGRYGKEAQLGCKGMKGKGDAKSSKRPLPRILSPNDY
jgi:hypothetical protein